MRIGERLMFVFIVVVLSDVPYNSNMYSSNINRLRVFYKENLTKIVIKKVRIKNPIPNSKNNLEKRRKFAII